MPSTVPAEANRLGTMRRLRAIIVKEFFQLIRDPSVFILSGFLPLLLLFLYGYGVSLDMNHLKLGLLLEDTSPDARSFAQSLLGSTYLDIIEVTDWHDLSKTLTNGKLKGLIVVPTYFSAFRERQDALAPIQVIADGSEPNTASFVQNYVQAAWQNWLRQEKVSGHLQGEPLIKIESRYWYNESLESHYFLVPGSIAIIMTLIGTLLTALVVAREWERGTMEALMVTPVSIGELLAGKLIPYFLLGMGSMLVATLVGIGLFDVPFRGSVLLLILVSAVFLLTALSIGLLISTLGKNQFVAAQISIVASFLPAVILSGFVFEISSMPWMIQLLTYLLAPRYFVSCLQSLFLVGNVWGILGKSLLCMIAIAFVVLLITSRRTVKRLD